MLYKFFGTPSGRDAVSLLQCISDDHTLRASNPTSFNDPFEFKVALDLEADEDTIRRRYFDDNPTSCEADYANWKRGLTENFKWWLANQVRSELLSSHGLICFTTVEDNHLLWSHYATQHKGFCIGFDESIVEDFPSIQGWGPVGYQRDAPRFRYFYDPPELFVKETFGYKSECWAYESEYRIVLDRQGIVSFTETRLREVILGCRAYAELRQYAQTQLGKTNYRYFQMVENFNSYSLTKVAVERGVSLMSSHF